MIKAVMIGTGQRKMVFGDVMKVAQAIMGRTIMAAGTITINRHYIVTVIITVIKTVQVLKPLSPALGLVVVQKVSVDRRDKKA